MKVDIKQFLEWLSDDDYFMISKDDIEEIIHDYEFYLEN